MNGAERARIGAGLALWVLLALFVGLRFEMTTDIAHFLPDPDDPEIASLSREIADSELSRTMILAIEAKDSAEAARASRAFEAALRADPRVTAALSFLEGGPSADVERGLFELYAERRLAFLAPDVERAEARTSDAGLQQAARELREELRGPLSPLVSRIAGQDPLLILPSLLRRLQGSRAGELQLIDGRFVAADGRTSVLFLGTHASALDADAQEPLLRAIPEAFASLAPEFGDSIRLDQSGINRYATQAARAIEADIKRVSIVSTVLLCAILLGVFRSLRFVALAALPVSAGMLSGAALVLLLFGRLHGITLAFGAALISVSIDYVVHLYCHHAIVRPPGGARESLRRLFRPLATGCITTLVGFMALASSSLAGLRELACFSIAGIAGAFLVTVSILPALLPAQAAGFPLRERLVEGITRGFDRASNYRRALFVVPLAALLFIAAALPGARLNPDLASLGRFDADIRAEDERVRAKVARFEQMRFVVSIGADEAAALAVNDRVAARLEGALAAGELEAIRNVALFLPSPETQRAVAAVALDDPTLPARLTSRFEAAGFRADAFAPFVESLSRPASEPLRFEDLATSPLGGLVRAFRVHLGERVGFLTFLGGVSDPEAIEARIADLPGALFVRQSELMNDTQRVYQRSTSRLLAWGIAGVLVLLALRYRDPRRTLAAFVPSILAVGVTLSALASFGRGVDLISLTALLFVVSMGVDYCVFLVDAYDEADRESVAAALTGALLACGSTSIAFGLLAFSQHPVLADLGLTAAVGIATSLLLAPTTLILLQPKRRS